MYKFILLIFQICGAQKLVVIVADGIGGSIYHRFSNLPAFRTFEEEGVWSTKLLPVFPTFPLPNRQSLFTGRLPRKHGFMDDIMYNSRNGFSFENFTKSLDFDHDTWWNTEPMYITATKQSASVAMFFFPECEVEWPDPPSLCVPPRRDGVNFAAESASKAIIEATKTHDLTLIYHPEIRYEISRVGPNRATDRTCKEVEKFQQSLEKLIAQVRERIDLNLMIISTHGLTHVPKSNVRYLDDYVPMELISTTVGGGALKQIIALNGKTHQVYTQLRYHTPIPNVKIYYTAPKIGDMPEWYHYKRSATVADLVLIAQPGYAIVTRDKSKQKPENVSIYHGMSGYNNHYPEMLGTFLAYGPLFKKGYQKGHIELTDLYHLMCRILKINCHMTPRRLVRIDDILTSDARVAMRAPSIRCPFVIACTLVLLLLL